MHTYEEIFQKWIKEWNTKKIPPITDEFCIKIGDHFRQSALHQLSKELTPLERRLFEIKHKRLDFLIKDFFTIRMRKIVKRIVERADIDITNLPKIEERLCSNLKDAINTYLRLVFLENQAIKDDEKDSGKKIIRILEQLDSFVGTDLKVYGPFVPEDICALPNENAKALIDRNVAVGVEIKRK